jgi:hypothetical protein
LALLSYNSGGQFQSTPLFTDKPGIGYITSPLAVEFLEKLFNFFLLFLFARMQRSCDTCLSYSSSGSPFAFRLLDTSNSTFNVKSSSVQFLVHNGEGNPVSVLDHERSVAQGPAFDDFATFKLVSPNEGFV